MVIDMASREEMKVATAQAKAMSTSYPTALMAHYEPKIGQVIVTLNSGFQFLVDPAKTQGLQKASRAELKDVQITGPGLGLYFPKLDVDVYTPGLLDGRLGSQTWAATQLGRAGGSAKTRDKGRAKQ